LVYKGLRLWKPDKMVVREIVTFVIGVIGVIMVGYHPV